MRSTWSLVSSPDPTFSRIAVVTALTTLMATVIGFVLTSKVENAVNTGLIKTAYEGSGDG